MSLLPASPATSPRVSGLRAAPRAGFSRHARDPATRGFTLTECLTVLVAAGLLVLLGLPSLGRVHARSEFAGCMSNQRQLMTSFLLYSQDNGDRLLGTTYQPPGAAALDLLGGGFWPGPVPEIVVTMTREAAFEAVRDGFAKGPLWPFVQEASVIHCPADPRSSALRPGRGWGYDSYSKAHTMGTGTAWEGITPFQRVTDVPRPATSFVFCEEPDPRAYNRGPWLLDVHRGSPLIRPGWVDPLAAFHDGGALFAFLDGHTEFRRWQDSRTLHTARSSAAGFESFYAAGGDAANPDFRWVWERFQHVAWRPLE